MQNFAGSFFSLFSMSHNPFKKRKQGGSLRTFSLSLPGNLSVFGSECEEALKTALKEASTKGELLLQFLKTTVNLKSLPPLELYTHYMGPHHPQDKVLAFICKEKVINPSILHSSSLLTGNVEFLFFIF